VSDNAIADEMAELDAEAIGDNVLPHFIVNKLPPGVAGLLVAAIFAAAMSSIDTSLNSSATVSLEDIWRRFISPAAVDTNDMRVLYGATIFWGLIGTTAGLAMIGVKSVLDAWWMLSGVFAGAQLGLFLLGFASKRVGSIAAAIAVTVGTPLILWLTVSTEPEYWPTDWAAFKSPLHGHMVVVVGTIGIIVIGAAASMLAPRNSGPTKSDE
jgi:SSS family solute:Na+ symporter